MAHAESPALFEPRGGGDSLVRCDYAVVSMEIVVVTVV